MSNRSLVYWCPDVAGHKCGYCKSQHGNISHGMWAKSLTVEDYQNLIDRGWRRSGHYCYKPIMDQICCPMYTIKCDVLDFKLSKSQKKVMKKFNKFLGDGVLAKNDTPQPSESDVGGDEYRQQGHGIPQGLIEGDIPDELLSQRDIEPVPILTETESVCTSGKSTKTKFKSGEGANPSKPPCKKAKVLRMELKQEKLSRQADVVEKVQPKGGGSEQKLVEDFLNDVPKEGKHKFRLELVSGPKLDKLRNIEFSLYRKYQMVVHNDPPDKCTVEGFTRFLVNSPLKITLTKLSAGHKYFTLTAKLYVKYQTTVHNDDPSECDEEAYTEFLLNSPLEHEKNHNVEFGSFHQLYWLDDKLIAVGVIDILPRCVSSVYFFYDPDYRNLTLGTYGSLREVEFARSLHKKVPSVRHYYMGFYIHSCPKMRYKGKLIPSYLLCPETYRWVPIEKCVPKLDSSKYCRLVDDSARGSDDENKCKREDVDNIQVFINRRLYLYKQLKVQLGGDFLFGEGNDVVQASLIGRLCCRNLIFIASH